MPLDLHALPASAADFLTDRHLATLTTLRPDGNPHVVPVGFTWDQERLVVRIITSGASRKARNVSEATADAGGLVGSGGVRAAVCQFEGWRWLTLEGPARVLTDGDAVREAERRYAVRYREPRPNPARVVLEIAVDRALGLLERPAAPTG